MKTNQKVYDRVLQILEDSPKTRDSDKALLWAFWVSIGKATNGGYSHDSYKDGFMNESDFFDCVPPETITRCRRKIQETFPELQPLSIEVRKERRIKEKTKGTFIYRDRV